MRAFVRFLIAIYGRAILSVMILTFVFSAPTLLLDVACGDENDSGDLVTPYCTSMVCDDSCVACRFLECMESGAPEEARCCVPDPTDGSGCTCATVQTGQACP